MKWLHLSDIHFADFGYNTETLRSALIERLSSLSVALDFILITGDCFYKNDFSKNIIPELESFIKQLGKACGVDKKRVYICQGNHDLNRSDISRNQLVEDCREADTLTRDLVERLIQNGNDSFRSLYRAVKGQEYVEFCVIEPKNSSYRIVSINSCLLSKDNQDYQNLRVCTTKLKELETKIKNDIKLNILIMHHGIDCLHPDDARSFEHWIEDNYIDAVFVGHTHQPNVVALNDVNRDIMQFTAGALMTDDYSIPSFYICEVKDVGVLTLSLYSYSKKTDSWELDSHNLRKFRETGQHSFLLPRHFEDIESSVDVNGLSCDELIKLLNDTYESKYGSRRFFSDKVGENEDFDAWKIVGSLANIGVPYPVALRLTIKVVATITSNEYSRDNLLHSTTLKQVIYAHVTKSHKYFPELNEYDIGIWASTYARHYDKNTGFIMTDGNREEPISYSLLKSSIIKEVVVNITGNEIFYTKIYSNELQEMAAKIMRFIKSLGIIKIKRSILLDLITEYVSEPPHPWFVHENRKELYLYHKENADKHLRELETKVDDNPIQQIEAAYHLFAAFLTLYDDYVGCTEVSPIKIMQHSVTRITAQDDRNLPMRRCMLMQLKDDLRDSKIKFDYFRNQVSIVYRNIVDKQMVTKRETINALVELRIILSTIESRTPEKWVYTGDAINDVIKLFRNTPGFIVRDPIKQFSGNAFVVAPYWDEDQKSQYSFGNDMLVCMLDGTEAAFQQLCVYLCSYRKLIIQELVVFKSDLSVFSSEERRQIRERLKECMINIRCAFIQERDFKQVSQSGWRNTLFRILCNSKRSGVR